MDKTRHVPPTLRAVVACKDRSIQDCPNYARSYRKRNDPCRGDWLGLSPYRIVTLLHNYDTRQQSTVSTRPFRLIRLARRSDRKCRRLECGDNAVCKAHQDFALAFGHIAAERAKLGPSTDENDGENSPRWEGPIVHHDSCRKRSSDMRNAFSGFQSRDEPLIGYQSYR
jgi:hypothetical protein